MAADAARARDLYILDETAAVFAHDLACTIEAALSGKKSGNEINSDIRYQYAL